LQENSEGGSDPSSPSLQIVRGELIELGYGQDNYVPVENVGVELCLLDRKLPVKLKRHEYEPIWDGTIYNISKASVAPISDCLTPKDEINLNTEAHQPSSTLSETEEFGLSSFWDSETYTKKDYIQLRNSIIEKYMQKREHISIQKFREIAVNVDIVYLVAMHRMWEHIGLINNIVTNC
jgi:SWIRM domain